MEYNAGMHRPLTHLVLAVALLLGQWLSAAHEPDHALQPGAAHACAVCVYSSGAGAAALPAAIVLVLPVAAPAPEATHAGHPLSATLRHHPIRGPPLLPA